MTKAGRNIICNGFKKKTTNEGIVLLKLSHYMNVALTLVLNRAAVALNNILNNILNCFSSNSIFMHGQRYNYRRVI